MNSTCPRQKTRVSDGSRVWGVRCSGIEGGGVLAPGGVSGRRVRALPFTWLRGRPCCSSLRAARARGVGRFDFSGAAAWRRSRGGTQGTPAPPRSERGQQVPVGGRPHPCRWTVPGASPRTGSGMVQPVRPTCPAWAETSRSIGLILSVSYAGCHRPRGALPWDGGHAVERADREVLTARRTRCSNARSTTCSVSWAPRSRRAEIDIAAGSAPGGDDDARTPASLPKDVAVIINAGAAAQAGTVPQALLSA